MKVMAARGLFSSSFRVGPQVRKEAVRVSPGQNLLPPRCARGVLVVSPEVRADPAAKGLGLKGGCRCLREEGRAGANAQSIIHPPEITTQIRNTPLWTIPFPGSINWKPPHLNMLTLVATLVLLLRQVMCAQDR
jgi:hypothetical protein